MIPKKNKEAVVEKEWVSKSGLPCVVLFQSLGFRCGYVGVPKDHPLNNCDYSERREKIGDASLETIFDVHGGITFYSPL